MWWETASSIYIVVNVAFGQVVCHHLAIAALFRSFFLSISFFFRLRPFGLV